MECGGGYYDDLDGYNDIEKDFMKEFEIGLYTGQRISNVQSKNEYKSIDSTRIDQLKEVVYTRLRYIGAIR